MRKSSLLSPILSTLPTKPKPLLNLSPPTRTFISNSILPHAPPVRQNASPKTPPTSAYIHLPFCRKRCHYCDFPILAIGSSSPPDSDPRITDYIGLLLREIASTKPPQFPNNPLLETVFFGGGTPSLVSPGLVSSLLDMLREKFGVCEDAEISMEMDPGTFDYKKMNELVGLGINRVSLGVQAFQEELLRVCGRGHGVKEVYEAIEVVRSCGIENWSLDLISSLPHQTPAMWEESLRITAEVVHPKHVSVYDLQVEQGTKFGALYSSGEFPLPSEMQSSEFYKMASGMLSGAGYKHYEISSYCLDGYECKHNYTYWMNRPFYGFGLGSASYVNGVRFSRPRKLRDYMGYVLGLENGVGDGCGVDNVQPEDLAMDVVMLSLRTARGLDVRSFGEEFGDSLVYSLLNVYKPYIESGHVVCLDMKQRAMPVDEFTNMLLDDAEVKRRLGFIRLSDPDGFLLSNELIALAFGAIAP